ncbi:hypothetical protein HDU97_009983 [Phlyctochytrium planicorne]|nr:hypothetical protein HDU97_009983 [Phlyctochytrium planicorne]
MSQRSIILAGAAAAVLMLASLAKADSFCNDFTILNTVNYDIVGFDLLQSPFPRELDECACATRCKNDPECAFFSFDPSTRLCYTKKPRPETQNLSFFKHDGVMITLSGSIAEIDNNNKIVNSRTDKGTEYLCKSWCLDVFECRYATLEVKPSVVICKLFAGTGNESIVGVRAAPKVVPPAADSSSTPASNPSSPSLPSPPLSPSPPSPPWPGDSTAIPNPPVGTSATQASGPLATSSSPSLLTSPPSQNPVAQPSIIVVTSVIGSTAGNPNPTEQNNGGNGSYSAGLGVGLGIAAGMLTIIASVVVYVMFQRKPKKAEYLPTSTPAPTARSPSAQGLVSVQSLESDVAVLSDSRDFAISTPEPIMTMNGGPARFDREKEPSKVDVAGFAGPVRKQSSGSGSLFSDATIYRAGSPGEAFEAPNVPFSKSIPLTGEPTRFEGSTSLKKPKSFDTGQEGIASAFKGSSSTHPELHKSKSFGSRVLEKSAASRASEKVAITNSTSSMKSDPTQLLIPTFHLVPSPRPLANQEMLAWTSQEVSDALMAAGVSNSHVEILRANDVNGYTLLLLNDGRMKEMGIEPQSARLLVMTAVNILRADQSIAIQNEAPPQYS